MRFRDKIKKSQISEWSIFYVDYFLMKTLLSPFKLLGKGTTILYSVTNLKSI